MENLADDGSGALEHHLSQAGGTHQVEVSG
jgi:hypothetical protein